MSESIKQSLIEGQVSQHEKPEAHNSLLEFKTPKLVEALSYSQSQGGLHTSERTARESEGQLEQKQLSGLKPIKLPKQKRSIKLTDSK